MIDFFESDLVTGGELSGTRHTSSRHRGNHRIAAASWMVG
jgi:hypothetical protein